MAISLAWWPEHPDLRPWRGSDYWLPASLCFDVPRGELARTGVAIRNVEPDASSRRASRAPRAGLACLWRGPGARRRSEALSGLAAATLGQAGPPVGRQRCRRGLHGGRRSAATYPRGTDRRCWGSCRHGRLRPPVPPNPVPDRSAPAPLSRRPSTSRARSSATAFREGPRRCTTPCSPIWRWGSRASLQPLTTQIRVLHVQQVGVAAPLPRLGTGRAPGWSPSHNRVGHRTLLEPRHGGAVELSRSDESRAFRRLRVRRSSSESPPQTPVSWRDSMAHLKQVSMTSQRRQTALASSIWRSAGPVFPLAKNSSGSSSRQAPLSRHVIRSRSSNMRYRGFAIMGVSSAYRPDSLWPAGVKVDTRKPYSVAAERASRTAQASVRTP